MPTLIIREPGRVAVQVAITDGATIGRDPSCALVVGHRTVSRRHARLTAVAAGVRIVDLDSTHGTRVDGKRVTEHLLRDGDVVHVGAVLLEYWAAGGSAERDEVTFHPGVETAVSGAAQRLGILYDISRAIGALGDADELAGRILAAALEALQCERGVVGLLRSVGAGYRLIARHRGASSDDVVVSRTVLDALLGRHERVLVVGREMASAPSLLRQGVRAAMGVPLVSAQGVLGFIYVDDRVRPDRFAAAELDFLAALGHLLAAALEQARERRRLADLAEALQRVEGAELVGASEVMHRLRRTVQQYAAASDTAVLISGESGTGKELVARQLHALSPRAGAPFVAVNCAAIPDTMIESELFGHERGAFTGALKPHRGKFVLAEGGTLFLDEVGDLSPSAQAKLLRALENGEVQPLGAERAVATDVRVLSATHKPLEAESAAGRFREDLFYRLAVGHIEVPPLRARGDDIVLLAGLFRDRCAAQMGKRVTGFGREALDALAAHPWPGNVRQLRNEIERAVILSEGPCLERLVLTPARAPAREPEPEEAPARRPLPSRAELEAALATSRGNVAHAARLLATNPKQVYRWMERLDLSLEKFRE